MRDDDASTVYAAELRIIEMALEVVLESTEPWDKQAKNGAVIFVESQAALKALRRPRTPSGQVYLAGWLGLIQWLAGRCSSDELLWTNTQKKQPKNRTAHRTLLTEVYVSQPERNGKFAEKRSWSGPGRGLRNDQPPDETPD
ncbi:hypothetical protein N7455_001432 [Penicillium solitum]|uniref:uncharacterized protein n=1 Tax=Penicillium solitum TaxID=60172 RepID=UPI0032C45F0D|nr:hypothetical protein N7536_006089 [Penicillium majusculum]KAJ5877967.1 hypothetical protein N7455_001432 [Penicillium solitum]